MLPPVGRNWQLISPQLQQKCFMRSAPGYFFSKKCFVVKAAYGEEKSKKK
jgi:hypothetical protein